MSKIQQRADRDLCTASSILSPHLENAGTKVRKPLRPVAELLDIQRIEPETTGYLKSKVITFVIQTGSYAVRFLDNPLQFTLLPKVPNDAFTTAEDEDVQKNKPKNGCTPFAAKDDNQSWGTRAPYFNPLCGAPAALICETEGYLDNQLVQASRDSFLSLYTTLNHLFLPADKRQEVLGHPYILHSSKTTKPLRTFADEAGATSKIYDPSYEYALNSSNAENKYDDTSAVILRGSLAGIFPFSRPKNLTLNQILRCDPGLNQMPLIPPHVEFSFRMRLADPLHLRCIDNGESTAAFFSSSTNPTGTGATGEAYPIDSYELEIKNISLYIQKIKWAEDKIHRQLSTGSISWNFEEYMYRATALPHNVVNTTTKDFLPANTQMVTMFICKSNQLYKDGTKMRSSDLTRFALPENLTKINIRLNNHTILFENGLKISREKCHQQEDAALFYSYLRDRQLTTDSFDSFYPNSSDIGYKQAFPLDLSQYVLNQPSQLSINCEWAGGCPADLYLVLVIPHAVCISRDSPQSAIWKSTAQIS